MQLAFSLSLCGQEYPYINITLEDGLPSNTVYDIYQDKKGFLWIGTNNGLARYDGANFRTFKSKGLKSSAIGNITEDSFGNLWMINFYGQVLFLQNDTLKTLEPWEKIRKSGFPVVVTRSDTVFIAMLEQGVYQYVISTKEFSQIRPSSKDNHKYVKNVDPDEIWCIKKESIQRIVPKSDYTYDIRGKSIPWLSPRIAKYRDSYILTDRFKNILFDLRNGEILDISSDKHTRETLLSVRDIKKIDDEALGFMGLNGLLILSDKHRFLNVFQGLNVSALESLKEEGIIVGTLDRGLFFAPSLNTLKFPTIAGAGYYRLVHDIKNKRIIVGDLVGNLHFYDYDGNLSHVINSPERTEVQALFIDEEEDVLLVYTKSLNFFDLRTFQKVKEVSLGPTKEILKFQGYYHFATSFGINSITPQGHKKYGVKGRMSAISEFGQDELVVSGQHGTFIYDWEKETQNSITDYFEFEVDGVNKVKKYNDYYLFGTHDNGIWIFKGSKFVKHLNIENGLLSNRINEICSNDSLLAVATNKGLSLIDWRNFEITNINRSKGLQNNEVTDLIFANGKLWVTNLTGLQSFDLPVLKNREKPQIHIDAITIDKERKSVNDRSVLLPYDFNEFSINMVVSNSIKAMGNTKIFYRVKELNGDQWNITTLKQSNATYLSLPPDTYTFEAYAQNEDLIRSNVLSLEVVVATPFWQKQWFQVVCVVFCLLVVSSIIIWYTKIVNKGKQEDLVKRNKAQELRIAQLTSIRAQMNPHFIFNTMSLIKGLVTTGNQKEANSAIQDFSQLMRNVLDLSAVELIPLSSEIEVLEKYLTIEKKRFDDQLDYRIEIADDVVPDMIKIPSLITQPFVENAVKHGLLHRDGIKKLVIRFNLRKNDNLTIEIEDNGIGRKAALQLRKDRNGHSFAIQAYRKRIELLNENSSSNISLIIDDLETEQGKAKGTLVKLEIPML